ncbi:hypothetical protein [Sediminibacterium sp.]|uniref:hypothetical protein n=1 Tax=Sediminibacterium sp. TaxID=1917865 RepID=UPI0025D53FAA|nr:hypothetical protein [Sediminibacterium sp.]MBW0179307.1 hypothetical protein [Sediminibacterium sp.]
MSEKDINNLLELVESQNQQIASLTKEEALQSLVEAGILEKDGKYAQPYQEMLIAAEQ